MREAPEPSFTPPKLAKKWACKPETVLSHIKSGRLRAFNLACATSRPRWRILAADVERFEHERSARPAVPAPHSRRKRQGNVIQFF